MMKHGAATRASAAILATLLLANQAVNAQQSQQQSSWQPFVSITPFYEGSADIDQGGDFSVGGVIARAGATTRIGQRGSAGFTLNYDYMDYSFSNPTAFGGVAPWGIVQRYGVSVPLGVGLSNGWTLGAMPSVDWFKEDGADTGESIVWGAIASATKRFDSGNRLGIGLGVYDAIEETRVFPFLIVDWRLSEHWKLVNPLAAGPSGPAGLEIDYLLNDDWTLGVGAAWRVTRFRLSEDGPVPNGVGEEQGVPVFFRATRNLSEQVGLHLYAGVVAAGKLRTENNSGTALVEEDFDPAPLFAATLVARF